MNLDELQEKFGGITLCQLTIVFLTGTVIIGTSCMGQSAIFFSAVPDHRCIIPPLDNHTLYPYLTTDNVTSLMIPNGDSCHRYAYNLSVCSENGDFSCATNRIDDVGVTACDNGYLYDTTYFRSTTISEWNLVCGRTYLDALANSLYFGGVLIGSFAVGSMLDWYGRKFTFLVAVIIYMASGMACALSSSYEMYIIFRVAVASAGIPCFISYFTYVSEISNKKYRVYVGGYAQMVTAIAHTVLPGMAYFVKDWRPLCIIISLIPMPFFLMYPFLPKSPRWLLAKGKEEEAKKVMEQLSSSQGKNISDEVWRSVITQERASVCTRQHKVLPSDLFKRPFTRVVTLVVIYMWFVISLVFYGLVLNIGELVGDPYINRLLNGFVEILAYVFYPIPTHYFGRRISVFVSYTLAGVCCISSMLFAEFSQGDQVMLEGSRWFGIIGKFFASLGFGVIYQYTSELYPTSARGTGLGVSSIAARVGSIIMPWTLELQRSIPWLAQTMFGILAIVAGAASLLLPETKGVDLVTTLEQAEKFNRENMKLARWVVCDSADVENAEQPMAGNPLVAEKHETVLR